MCGQTADAVVPDMIRHANEMAMNTKSLTEGSTLKHVVTEERARNGMWVWIIWWELEWNWIDRRGLLVVQSLPWLPYSLSCVVYGVKLFEQGSERLSLWLPL
jgi:hypothetical protein